MTRFYNLNKKKIWGAYKFLSLSFIAIAFLFLSFSFFQDSLPPTKTIVCIFLAFGIGFPPILLSAIITPRIINELRWESIMETEAKLRTIGFVTEEISASSKWFFTEEVLCKKEGELEIIARVKLNCFCFDLTDSLKHTSFCIPLRKLKNFSAKNIDDEIKHNHELRMSGT